MSEKKSEVVITDKNLEEFKKLVRRAVFLKHDDETVFKAIPNHTWREIFSTNFDGNFEYARRLLLNKYQEIERIDGVVVDREKNKIFNLDKATKFITDSIDKKEPILFITDFDNDGSLAQAVINEYLVIDKTGGENMHVEYAQTVNGNANRGLTVDHVNLIVESKGIDPQGDFLIVTADNGINSREEQEKIQLKYPKAKIVITDHHNPDPEMVIVENDRTVIFNPHYNPTEFFKKFNISGATTAGVLMKNVIAKRYLEIELVPFAKNFEKMNTLFKVANLLDYVNTHPADKPEKDYIITKFVQLQPLMNINNSISKIITGEIPVESIAALEKKIPNLNVGVIFEEAKNIHTQNTVAKILLNVYKNRDNYKYEPLPESEVKEEKKSKKKSKEEVESVSPAVDVKEDLKNKELTRDDFSRIFLKEIQDSNNYTDHSNINPNYIEQLRPLIFGLAADYNKSPFLNSVENKMVELFESIRLSEKRMANELRRGEVITKNRLENSVIAYADPHILKVFNRKFLNKVYNDENPGFSLTLDNIKTGKVSGSFRSLYDISDILKDKEKLESQLRVKIETPGHERAAGFILTSVDSKKYPITEATIEAVNVFINNSIQKIKENEIINTKDYLLTDLDAIKVIDRINHVVRGNVSNFEKITPLLQLTKDTVWTDSYTTEQFTMEEVCKSKKYGYISLNTNFDGGTIIIPVELIRRLVDNNYKDYLSLGYMDEGVFMVDRIVPAKQATNIIDIRTGNEKTKVLVEAWEQDFKEKNIVNLTREQIAENPFYKYHDYGNLNFDIFEKMVIGIIDSNKIDTLAVFDVEANGFGNGKLINIGFTNYNVNKDSGTKMNKADFYNHFFHTSRKETYLLNSDQVKDLVEITAEDFAKAPMNIKKVILQKYEVNDGVRYFEPKNASKIAKKKVLPYEQIKNYVLSDENTITFNRSIEATMLAYLVKDKDFRVPQEMINLTGITQEVLEKYGKLTSVVDKEITEYYKDKKVLFGAHNTPYDARISRANLPNFYDILRKNKVYDSALFSKEERLAYDDVKVSSLPQIDAFEKGVLFYNNNNSDFNLTKFIETNHNGYYPDRTNQYLLEIDNGEYYLVDKVKHEKIKIDAKKQELLDRMEKSNIPGNTTKYSVEKLSEQWVIHALLLNDENFDVKLVDLNKSEYKCLLNYVEDMRFFQENYDFDISPEKNIINFISSYMEQVKDNDSSEKLIPPSYEDMLVFSNEFLELNKKIASKFADAWMYKSVLEIKDPNRLEVTKDLIDLVNYQTSIPKEKIEQIFEEAIAYKNKYNIDHVIHHEMHANGPWRGDIKGDIAFEDKLTLTMLATKDYNPYSHDIKSALNNFNQFQIKAKLNFEVADGVGDSVAQDSYSFRQGILYDREVVTSMIEKIQEREDLLEKDGRHIIKFKLDNDVLPPKTAIYAIVKNDKKVSREDIEKHKKMLGFIMLNEQLRTSWHNAPSNLMNALETIYDSNRDKIIEYKEELAKYYDYMEYNKKDYHIKEFLDKASDIAIYGKMPKRESKVPKLILPTADIDSINNVREIVDKMIRGASELLQLEPVNIDYVHKMIDYRLTNPTPTRMEYAIKNTNGSFGDFSLVNEVNFLEEVDIVRKTPVERLLTNHRDFRLLNGIVEQFEQYALENKPSSKRKP